MSITKRCSNCSVVLVNKDVKECDECCKAFLVHELSGNVIAECRMILKALKTYGIRGDKFDIVETN
jgi:hypothetical protein